jgi:hypothetical protein
MMELAPLVSDFLLVTQMPQMLINLVVQFPNSTILHNEFLKFVGLGVKNPKFALAIVMFYVPIAVDIGENEQNKLVKSVCLHVMDIFFKAAKDNKDLDRCLSKELHGVKQFANGPLKRYMTRCQTPYGGPVPLSEMALFKNLFGL